MCSRVTVLKKEWTIRMRKPETAGMAEMLPPLVRWREYLRARTGCQPKQMFGRLGEVESGRSQVSS